MTLWPVCFFACALRLMSTQETLILLSRAAVKDQCHDSVTIIILVTAGGDINYAFGTAQYCIRVREMECADIPFRRKIPFLSSQYPEPATFHLT